MAKVVKSRVEYIDAVAGVMIAWMILGHCRYFSNTTLPFFKFLGFYMPWFFYKSGMFFTTKSSMNLLKNDARKLLRYYVVYSIAGWIIWCACGLIEGSLSWSGCFMRPIYAFIHHGSISGNGALWFLFSLFIVRQLANLMTEKCPPPILAAVCFLTAYFLYSIGWYKYCWWFGNVFSGLCFFLLGYWLKEKENNRWIFATSTFFFVLIICAYSFKWIDDFPYLYMHANSMYNGNYLLFYPTALAGIIMTNNFFNFLYKRWSSRLLEYIGVNAMTLYTTHWILLVVVLFVATFLFEIKEPVRLFEILLIACIIFLPLITEIVNYTYNKQSKP